MKDKLVFNFIVIETHKFRTVIEAEVMLREKGFDWATQERVDMGEGYHHIWITEYKHKSNGTYCRIADLRNACYKQQEGDRLPRPIGFVQLSIQDYTDRKSN